MSYLGLGGRGRIAGFAELVAVVVVVTVAVTVVVVAVANPITAAATKPGTVTVTTTARSPLEGGASVAGLLMLPACSAESRPLRAGCAGARGDARSLDSACARLGLPS